MSSINEEPPPPYTYEKDPARPYTYETVDRATESAIVSYDGGKTWEPIPAHLLEGLDQSFQKNTRLSYPPGIKLFPEDIKADLVAAKNAMDAYRAQTGGHLKIKTLDMTEIAPSTALKLSREQKQNIVWSGNRAYRFRVIEAFDRPGNVIGERAHQNIGEPPPRRNLDIRDDRSRGRC